MSSKIGIVDYGMGNIRSVANAFREVGAEPELVSEPEAFSRYGRLVLPGVGAFGEAMRNLEGGGMIEPLNRYAQTGKPVLGICLGMQVMCASSTEGGEHQGLGWIDAEVLPLEGDETLKIPHIGWNEIVFNKENGLIEGLKDEIDVYFVHSYYVKCRTADDELATCSYGNAFAAMFSHENLHGAQFHPEKSQKAGLKMLENFARL